jgi:hypothetical protein
MIKRDKKGFFPIAFVGVVLTLSLPGCGGTDYENFEECQLKEMQKTSSKNNELSHEALMVISRFCVKYPFRDDQEQKQAAQKKISEPKWIGIGPKQGYSDNARRFIDANNIEINESERIFWIKSIGPGQEIKGKNYQIGQISVDCSLGKIMTISYETYVNGKSEDTPSSNWSYEEVRPGSMGADLYEYVCK